jgi:hypothetical protein
MTNPPNRGARADYVPRGPGQRRRPVMWTTMGPLLALAAFASAQKLAAEVKWALCMRSHGLPGFPDPNSQGAFDSSRFNDRSPSFQTASKACQALGPTGPISAVPGNGSGP